MAHHIAAVLEEKGQSVKVSNRLTPTPGPSEVLVTVHAFALNPVDVVRRNLGIMVKTYPTVLGSDAAGVVTAVGQNVTTLEVGDRVTGLITGFFTENDPDYGAMQQKALVLATNLAKIPDRISFQEAAVLPIALVTVFSGLLTLGIDYTKPYMPTDKKALLVHGASSSVGTFAVQVAHQLGFNVYATSSPTHHAMVRRLGAARVFDYKTAGAGTAISDAAREDGVDLTSCFLATGSRDLAYEALASLRGTAIAEIAHAPIIRGDIYVPDGFNVTFITAPEDAVERNKYFAAAFAWLEEKLASGAVVPSPSVTLVEGGLQNVNAGMDQLLRGVSGTKLVVDMQ